MPKPEIVIIRHFSRTCLVISTSCQWSETYGEASKFQGMVIMQWPCLWVGARGSWPCLSIHRPGCRVIRKGRKRPLVFPVSCWKWTSHPTTSEPGMLGSICCVICSLFLLPDYLLFHQLGCPGLLLPVLTWELAFTTGWAKATSNGTSG